MKTLLVALVLIVLSSAGCKKSGLENDLPDCIKSNIEANKNKADWGIESIDEYKYQGMLVYVYNPNVNYADAVTSIIKSDCTYLCSLGGIAGNQLCNGDKFYDKAVYIRTVWKK